MQIDDPLYKAFLEQVQELENFRMTYASVHPHVPMDRDDPDVKRMIEAMAFFSARTHRAGMNNIVSSQLRIFQQCFPYLLLPLPSMGMLKARLTGRFAEAVDIPKGCEFTFSTQDGKTALFLTLFSIRILPLFLTRAEMPYTPGKGFRLLLQLNAPYSRNEDIGKISFHINHLNNYKASLQVFHTLKQYIRKTSIVFDEKFSETKPGIPCSISFGPHEDQENIKSQNPVLKERFFFHFPMQELYLNIDCPAPPRNWSQIIICFDLDIKWPRNLILSKEVFHLYSIPVMNLKKEAAQPVLCDGTREEYPVFYSNPEKGFQIQELAGVYTVENQGMIPLRPGILSGGNNSYEIIQKTDLKTGIREHRLLLNMPEAFEKPKTIAVDAMWFQPEFSKNTNQQLNVQPYGRTLGGLEWETLGRIVPHNDNRFGADRENFLNLFILKNKPDLTLDDLFSILRAMGNVLQNEFKDVINLLTDMRVEHAPPKKNERAGSLRRVYYLKFAKLDPSFMPLVETFIIHVEKVLDGWLPETAVEIRIEVLEK
ncbi:Type VI secretion system, TssF-like [Desulfonema limicola]|uniref:Type VI secretion system, TssF-like n=1 Tax=Desulfonema limicola TaxID=45656 RepID=A0A975GHA2_9BACT|nr:type VI secretion system baseplate subunit TssF [Desulfonema limicola]QTA81206.1 Type VI secretion system, TssF-like [Desulfonema limicola]